MDFTPKWQAFVLTQTKAKTLKTALDVPLCNMCTFRIGGKARQVIYPQTHQTLCDALRYLQEEKIPFFVVGNGSNLLFSSNGFDGVMIATKDLCKITLQKETLTARCGVKLSQLCRFAALNGLSGLEFAIGIPATVGGAVCQNAGAYGHQIGDVLEESCAYDLQSNTVSFLDREEHSFAYRKSRYQAKKEVLLSATFHLKPDDPDAILARMARYTARRKETQPCAYPSAGSVFLHQDGVLPAQLLDRANLKGFRIGDAMISPNHAGFIVNCGNATDEDVQALIAHCQTVVQEKYGVLLKPEIELVSDAVALHPHSDF